MRQAGLLVLLLSIALSGSAYAQRRGAAPARKPAPPAPLTTAAADLKCRESLGVGVRTHASFCFVLAGREPGEGVLVTIPPHTGAATLMFDLHNRHTYSEEDIRAGQGFAKYTAIVAVLSMKGDVLGRGAVQTEFRTAQDLYDRVSGGAGPGGVKAVAPLGKESINVTVPAGTDVVSILGEVLDATTAAGHETATPGRTVAIISNVRVEYRAAAAAHPAPAKPKR
jgi:hypothetical protein